MLKRYAFVPGVFVIFYLLFIHLHADQKQILVIDNGSTLLKKIELFLQDKQVPYKIVSATSDHENVSELLSDNVGGIILSGSVASFLSDPMNISALSLDLALLLEAKVPVLGICFGHQIMATAYDGSVKKLPETIKGPEKITIVKPDPLFNNVPETFEMFESHRDGVVRIPDSFILLATSASSCVEAMKHKDKPIYGVQFHPESRYSGDAGKQILTNFLNMCGIQ